MSYLHIYHVPLSGLAGSGRAEMVAVVSSSTPQHAGELCDFFVALVMKPASVASDSCTPCLFETNAQVPAAALQFSVTIVSVTVTMTVQEQQLAV